MYPHLISGQFTSLTSSLIHFRSTCTIFFAVVVFHENEINAQTFLCLDNKKNHRQRHSNDHGHYNLCGLLVSSLITVTSPPPQNGFAKLIFDGFLVGNFWFFYFPTISWAGNNSCNEGTITTDTVF